MPKVDIDTAYIEKLAELLARTGLTEIEICQSDTRIRVAKQLPAAIEYVHHQPPAAAPASGSMVAAAASTTGAEPGSHADAGHPVGTVTSPMVGTAYLTPEPNSPPFIKVGDMVKEGQTLLIIEAMKVMNSIRAPKAGRVSRIFASNAAPVEYGEPLLVLE
jgi:acetyl-CoA carboxylase biotin carboxyl carrier protein